MRMIMSTEIARSASASKMRATTPGLSGSAGTVSLTSFLSQATPLTITDSKLPSSPVTTVPGWSLKLERTWIGIPYFMATSTERSCSTFAPSDASSSISSNVMRSTLRAAGQTLGSVVNTPSTSV
jgi:hypothetical protein